MNEIPANFPNDTALTAFGAYAVGVLDGYLKDGATAEQVLDTLFFGTHITGISLPLDGD